MNSHHLQFESGRDLAWKLFLLLSAISLIVISSDSALASGSNDVIGQTLCRLTNNLTGGIAKGIATLAIFSVGVGLFLGKLNWGIAAATAAGVGVIFAAPKLVAFVTGSDSSASCSTG